MRTLLYIVFINLFGVSAVFAADTQSCQGNNLWSLFLIILSGVIGYIVGAMKSFREEKQKAYGELIAPILKMAYNPQDVKDEQEFSKALTKLWLYGSKRVTQKMEHAIEIMHNPSRGNITKAFQEAVVEMRKDIQLFTCQNIKPEDVNHLYTRIAGVDTKNKKNA
jgi:hypothetical protein